MNGMCAMNCTCKCEQAILLVDLYSLSLLAATMLSCVTYCLGCPITAVCYWSYSFRCVCRYALA